MNIKRISVQDIVAVNRWRDIAEKKVYEIAESMERDGQLQNIGVRATDSGYVVIYGAHRLAAAKKIGLEELVARIFRAEVTDEEARLLELTENISRNDFTRKEMKAAVAECGRLLSTLRRQFQTDIDSTVESGWLMEIAAKMELSKSALYNYWAAFCQATERKVKPAAATEADRQAFFDWLEAEQEKDQLREKLKTELFEAEQAIKKIEAIATAWEEEKEEMNTYLEGQLIQFGQDAFAELERFMAYQKNLAAHIMTGWIQERTDGAVSDYKKLKNELAEL